MSKGAVQITLAELPVGEEGKVVVVASNSTLGSRLMELGFVPGMLVKLLGIAPLGDPLEFELCGYRLSLRRSEAACVVIERIDSIGT